jgi:dihydroflavonol-4-reductase
MGSLVLVTGGTGFIGRHAVAALLRAGHRVRALCRSDEPGLVQLGAEVVRGDVMIKDSVQRALEGVDAVVHGAGLVSRAAEDTAQMLRLHVNGTRNVVGLACERGVRRVIHLSTSGTVAVGADASMVYREDDPVPFEQLARFPYYLSKWLAERAAEDCVRLASKDGPKKTTLITLNPSLALGPGDTRGSSTTDVKRFLNRELPIVPSGGFSFVDARDVADTVVTALDQGRAGERYLLGGLNCTFAEFFHRLGEVSGVRGPALGIPLPRRVATLGIGLLERVAGVVGATLPVSTNEAEMASCFWYVDARKAERTFGFHARDPMVTLLDTVKDLRGERTSSAVEKRVG